MNFLNRNADALIYMRNEMWPRCLLAFLAVLFVFVKNTAACVYTYSDVSGNRVVSGKSTFPRVQSFDLHHPRAQEDVNPPPIVWVLGSEGPNQTIHWFAADSENHVWGFAQPKNAVPKFTTVLLTPIMPFLASFPFSLPQNASHLSHPVCVQGSRLLMVDTQGDVVLLTNQGRELKRAQLNAPLDARLVLSRDGSMAALYTQATDERYAPGALGDKLEAAALTVLRTDDLTPVREIRLSNGNAVFEGISPMWVDLDDDGEQELLSTISDSSVGASLFLFNIKGEVLARSAPIGVGGRWRHQLVVAPLGPDGSQEVVNVVSPHVDKTLQFLKKEGKALKIVAARNGYSTHEFGSRNVDMAVAGDFDGDGRLELVVPSADRRRIVGTRHEDHTGGSRGVLEVWDYWVGKQITSNIAAVPLSDGRLALGVGLSDGSLRVFSPFEGNMEGRERN